MKLLLFISLLLITCQAQNVISRNGKVNEMINELQKDLAMYDQLIETIDQKFAFFSFVLLLIRLNDDYENCINEIKIQNCSESEIWQQDRSKNSKNITNLQQKIKTHNQTIDQILQLNKHEVTKQNLTMAKLFPKISKVKNDIEFIENMMFLIEDTYLNLDTAGKSILLLFDHQFGNQKAQSMQQSFIQLMNKKSLQNEDTAESSDIPPAQSSESLPLIDEEIFVGEVDSTELEVSNLFAPTEKEEKLLYADDIPESVIVNEHDSNDLNSEIGQQPINQNKQQDTEFEDLRINEVKEDFKNEIKELGKSMHEQLEIVHKGLQNELEQLTQSVADLEKAIIDLHHKHAKQIVQIYMETKKLQQIIYQLDDSILTLDAQIFDCKNSNIYLEKCEQRKSTDLIIIDDFKTEKSFNQGILKELSKLVQFEDKNIYEPEGQEIQGNSQQLVNGEDDKTEEEIEQDKVRERIAKIKAEEKIVEQEQLEKSNQEQEVQLQQQQQKEPEHLADVPEETQSPPIIQSPTENLQEEDKILEEVENGLKEEGEPELEEPDQEAQQIEGELPVREEPQEAQLEFLKKNKKK